MAFLVPVFTAVSGAIGSLGGIGAALGIAGAGVSAYSSIQAGKAASDAAKYNATVKEQQATTENQQAAARATEYATRTRQKVAGVRAGAVQSGLETSGSVNDILTAVNEQGMLDQLTSLYDGGLRAQGLRAGAAQDRAEGRSAKRAGYINAVSGITSGVSGYLE